MWVGVEVCTLGTAKVYLDFAKVGFHFHFRDWSDYENGFGNFVQKNGEYWLGNRNLHLLTTQGKVYLIPNSLEIQKREHNCFSLNPRQ